MPGFFDKVMANHIGTRIPVGFSAVDQAIGGGLRNGTHIVMAIPGAGKTTLATNMMRNMIKAGYDVIFVSAEMAYEDIVAKILSLQSLELETPLDANEVLALGQCEDGAKIAEKLASSYLPYAQHTIIVPRERIDSPDAIGHIEGNYCECTGRKPVVIIDYLQILATKFPQGTDKPIAMSTYRKYYKKALKEIGIENPGGPHRLRHTYATLLTVVAGVDPVSASELCRHLPRMTVEVYSHPVQPALQEAVDRLSEVFSNIG